MNSLTGVTFLSTASHCALWLKKDGTCEECSCSEAMFTRIDVQEGEKMGLGSSELL